jgi:hypothetical protein
MMHRTALSCASKRLTLDLDDLDKPVDAAATLADPIHR